MKPIPILVTCGAAATALAGLVIVIHTHGQSEPSGQAASATNDHALSGADTQTLSNPFRINLETWEIFRVDGLPVEDELNSPQAVESRRLANLAAVDPVRYEQLFPKSPAERAAMQEALDEIQHPKSLQQRLAEMNDPAERAQWTAAIEAISQPVALTEGMIQSAIQNDPDGPWAVLRNR